MITKEMWKKLEEEMQQHIVQVIFGYKGHELTIQRVRVKENQTALGVYIDDEIKGAWLLDETRDKPAILDEVWNTRSRALYKPSRVKEVKKKLGVRRLKEMFPDIDEKQTWLEPYFNKASVLCRQYKKLEGLKLVKADFLEVADE
ncbi:hypothetical protein [Grimontia hollisae]|uniref:hypothetical protein n=1 Tax=Grimontia hollisae TaxID=673 RepID=UPI000E024DD0|nr:hypothetical protein [Grimontia hollisae]STQ75513.1 Uncharacterised protein [Grimontia hollisae]